mmetsp:Transcript_14265/g.32844  ORF Transcript_14265/g.32844 Transcript_14265/m.32844 type:complete len:558 (-) Transcript_14265:176-1849(-)|eukprot:749806-Hanusia_phi.AAC.3
MQSQVSGQKTAIQLQIEKIASLLCSEDTDQAAEAAKRLRTLSMEYREDDEMRYLLGSSYPLRQGILYSLMNGSDMARYWCCHCIVSLSHKHSRNQTAIANHPGLMEAILGVLQQGTAVSRGAACSALVESTFRNADNALLVAKTPGMMQGVVSVMQSSVGDVKDDAAGVLRNCSNYSKVAAEVIVKTPGVLDALIEMGKGQFNSDRFTAMGTIQNLSRCESVAPLLCKSRVINDALLPCLHANGMGEEHDVMRAEALMAITNLSSEEELRSLEVEGTIVAVIVQMLRCALKNQAWRDVAWYDSDECLRPLALLTTNKKNCETLQSVGIIPSLKELLFKWLDSESCRLPSQVKEDAENQSFSRNIRSKIGLLAGRSSNQVCERRDESGVDGDRFRQILARWELADLCNLDLGSSQNIVPREIDLAILALVNLARQDSCLKEMLDLEIVSLLRCVSIASRNGKIIGRQFCTAELWVMESRHLAVSMGQHLRLGSHPRCFLMAIDAPVLWMIIQNSCTVSAVSDCLAEALDNIQRQGQRGERRSLLNTAACSFCTPSISG